MNNEVLNLLGILNRGGLIIYGETAIEGVINDKVRLVILATDTGESVAKKVTAKCEYHSVALIKSFTKDELGTALGKNSVSVIGIKDKNAAIAIQNKMKGGGNYGQKQ